MCLYISFWTSFFFSCSPHGNILLKPWDKFCWEVRMSMLIFFPLLRRLSLTEAPVPSPMVTMLSVKEACSVSCLLSFAIRHWGTSPHQAALWISGRPQHLGDVFDFQWGKMSPQWAVHRSFFSARPIFCCDCHTSVLIPGCCSRLS